MIAVLKEVFAGSYPYTYRSMQIQIPENIASVVFLSCISQLHILRHL